MWKMAHPDGFEPSYELLESSVLPLNYGSIKNVQCANTLNVLERDVKPLFDYDLQKDHTGQCTECERDKAVDLVFPHECEECLDVWNGLLGEFLDFLDECVPDHSVVWVECYRFAGCLTMCPPASKLPFGSV